MTWYQSTGPGPSGGRVLASVAYDPVDHYTVLFGGGIHSASVSYSDTWTFAGGVWTKLSPSPSPIGRLGAGLVYDANDHYLLLFGGFNESGFGFLNDSWAFSGGHWRQLAPTSAPSPRWIFGMDYDTVAHEVVLFGGGNFPPLGETWTFTAGNWTHRYPTLSPPWRSDGAMAYDGSDSASVLFGGNANGTALADTWLYAGGIWTKHTGGLSPPASQDFGLAFDPMIQAVVLASGGVTTSSRIPETWSFGSNTWQNLSGKVAVNYTFRNHQVMAWDGLDQVLIEFGGNGPSGFLSDTWLFDVLSVTCGPSTRAGEVPFNLGLTTILSGGITPIFSQWRLTGNGALAAANGSITVTKAGSLSLNLSILDRAGLALVVGPFAITAIPSVTLHATANTTKGNGSLSVAFTAIASNGSAPFSYAWAFGDGINGTGPNLTHRFTTVGVFHATVKVTDSLARNASRQINITVLALHSPPPSHQGNNSSSALSQTTLIIYGAIAGVVAVAAAVAGFVLGRRRRARTRPPGDESSET